MNYIKKKIGCESSINKIADFLYTNDLGYVTSTDESFFIMNTSLDIVYSYGYETAKRLINGMLIGDKFNSEIIDSIKGGVLLALSNDEIPKPKRIIYNINASIALTRGNDGYYYDYSSNVNKRFIGRRAYLTYGMQ